MTLDETIKNLEDGLKHLSAILISEETWNDSLRYLKEYRMQLDDIVAKRKVLSFKIKQYDEMVETVKKQGQEHEDRCQAEIARYLEAVRNCEEAENRYRQLAQNLGEVGNDPLTWDELKSMEGKPVWVESSDSFNRRRWMFVGEWFDDDEMRLFDIGNDYPDYVSKNGYESGTWQAYRKERKE